MKPALVVLLLGGCLCAVHGGEESTLDVASTDQSLLNRVQNLERDLAELKSRPHVAFFAGFQTSTVEGNHGPFPIDSTIKYNQVLTNIGNGYNIATGTFTAPVKGLYVFHFTAFTTYSPVPHLEAILKKNGVKLAVALDKATSDTHDTSTRVAVVALEAMDQVYVDLNAQCSFYDYQGVLNSFSGFLLFPM